MTQSVVDVGVQGNDGSGDSLYESGNKINDNFLELFARPSVESHIRMSGNLISSSDSNADITLEASGTGHIVFPAISFIGNNITGTRSNEDLVISASGSGKVVIGSVGFSGATISSSDSSIININEGLIVDGTLLVTGASSLSGAISGGTGSTLGNLTLANGSITDSSGALSFGNENLTTTGTFSAETGSTLGNLTFADGTITDSSGAISFGNENLSTTGTLTVATSSTFGNLTLADGSITDSGGSIDFGNENLATTSTSMPINNTLTVANGSITDSSGAISFNDENVTTTGTITRATGSTIGNLTLANGSITDSSGAISFGNENLVTTSTSITLNSTLTVANGSITDSSGAISFGDDNIATTGTLTGVTTLTASSLTTTTGNSSLVGTISIDNLTFNDNIIASTSNADIIFQPGGSGVVNISDLTIDSSISLKDNVIQVTTSNADIFLTPSGTGSVVMSKVDINEGTVDNVVIGNSTPVAGSFTTLTFNPAGAGSLVVDGITISDNQLTTNASNSTLEINANSSGRVSLNSIVLPASDGSTGQVFKTDGSNDLSFETSAILLGISDIQDGTASFAFKSSTTIDHVVFTGAHELISSTIRDINTFSAAKYDSMWYHMITRNDDFDTLATGKVSVVHGLSDDSAIEAFMNEASVTRTSTEDIMTISVDVNDGLIRLRGVGNNPECSCSFYAIGLGDNDSTGYTGEPNATVVATSVGDPITTTIDPVTATGTMSFVAGSTATTIATFDKTQFDSAWFIGVIKDITNTEWTSVKYSVVHNNDSVYLSQSGINRTDTGLHYIPTITGDVESGTGLVQLNGSATELSNSFKYYRIGLGDNDSAGYSGEQEAGVVINADIDSASEAIDSWAHADYRGAKYFISINNATKTEITNMEALVVHDGTNAFVTTYNIVNTTTVNDDVVTLTAAIDGDNVVLSGAGHDVNLRVHAYRILLADDEADRTGTNVNVIGEVTVSSTATAVDTFDDGSFDAAHYIVIGTKSNDSSISEVNVISDQSDSYVMVGPTISTQGTDLLAFSTTYSGSTVTLKASSTGGGSTTVNAYRIALQAPPQRAEVVDSWAHASYRGAKYYVSINDLTNNEVMNVEILAVHNGTDAFMVDYGNITTKGADLCTFTVDISGNDFRLLCESTQNNTRVNAYRILLADDENDSASTNINVVGEVTVSSAATTLDTFSTNTYQGAHYIIVASKSNDSAILEATVISDGTTAFVSQGPQVSTEGTALLQLAASHSSSTTTVTAAATTGGSTKVNAYRINIARGASTASTTTTLNAFSASTYRSASYFMQIVDEDTPNYESFELRVTHDGSDAYVSTFARIGNLETDLATITADISGGNVRLLGEISNTNNTEIKFVRRIFNV